MATVNFSVPVDVKNAFNKAFEGENKSAVLAMLMRQAVEERKRKKSVAPSRSMRCCDCGAAFALPPPRRPGGRDARPARDLWSLGLI